VLLFLTTMMGLVTMVLLVEARAARNQYYLHAGYYAAAGGLETAARALLDDDPAVDGPADAWYANGDLFSNVDVGNSRYRVECRDAVDGSSRSGIADEESRLNLNTADAEELKRLHPALTDEVVAAILERREETPFASVQEVAAIEGMEAAALTEATETAPTGLAGLLTVYGDGKINVNTAPPAVLACLPGMTMEAAKAVVAAREGEDGPKPIEDLDDAEKVSGLSAAEFGKARSRLKVASSYFRVIAVGWLKTRPGVERELRQVVRREADGIQVIRFEQIR